uniref:Uncharacterized protein n=1 Tax=Anopheles minimus TaxID=112268 RepID=A0A182W869_9DIPT
MNFVKPYKIEALVKQWAPLVWLAPNEKYMPGDVSKFLEHVHAEEAKVVTVYPGNEITELDDLKHYDDGMTNELSYYDPVDQRLGRFRNKRNFKDPSVSLDLLFNFPIGNESKNWYLVTNNDIEELITHKESFLHGQNPLKENVPIYAVISMCQNSLSEMSHKPDSGLPFTQPVTTTAHPSTHLLHNSNNQENEVAYTAKDRLQYKRNPYAPTPKNIFELQPNLRQTMNKVEKSIRLIRKKRDLVETTTLPDKTTDSTDIPPIQDADDITVGRKVTIDSDDGNGKHLSNSNTDDSVESAPRSDENEEWETITERRHDTERYHAEVSHDYPHFHVTYWMFYPYSQGKIMCTIDLGPFGPWPIPLIFGMCLGTKKEFGSHVGDWEHMSLYFRGRKEPDEMYVSAHDAGAFYSYERLTGTFEYHSQETRKGILQQPTFPKTVVTSSNHPVLFAAEGSHGLWTAPGKHKFVRVPRLYDINGFGMPWSTWRNVQVIYENGVQGRSSLQPKWMKFNGRWGNPKTKCHPLKRIGLHICELTDGNPIDLLIQQIQKGQYCTNKLPVRKIYIDEDPAKEPVVPCPRCSDRNQQNMVRYLFINLSEAIYKCEAYDCMYPYRNFKFKNFEESTVYRYEQQSQHEFDADYTCGFPNSSCSNFENTIDHIDSVDFNMDFLPCEDEANAIEQPAAIEPFSQAALCNIPSTNFDTGFIDEILEDLFPDSTKPTSNVKQEAEGASVKRTTTVTDHSPYRPASAQFSSGRKLERCLKVFEKSSKASEDDVFKKPKAPESDKLVVEHITPTKLRIKRVKLAKNKVHSTDGRKRRERTAKPFPLDMGSDGKLELKQARALVKNKKLKPLDLVCKLNTITQQITSASSPVSCQQMGRRSPSCAKVQKMLNFIQRSMKTSDGTEHRPAETIGDVERGDKSNNSYKSMESRPPLSAPINAETCVTSIRSGELVDEACPAITITPYSTEIPTSSPSGGMDMLFHFMEQ